MDNENNKEQLIIQRLKKLVKRRKRPYYSAIYCVHVFRFSCTLCGKKVDDRDNELFMDLCSEDGKCWDLIYELLEAKCGEYLSRMVITKYNMMRIVDWISYNDPQDQFPIGRWCCSKDRC
jgi:hypothetical protein